MKKLFKFIPLLALPMLLTSCLDGLFTNTSQESNQNSGNTSQTTSDTSTTSSSGGSSSGGSSDTNIYVTSLTISGKNNIFINEETTLTATYSPSNPTSKTINWYSSNTSVATITAAGKVKGKAEGNTVITAKMKSSKTTYIEATFNMTVATPEATGIVLNKTSATLGYGKTIQLSATVNPTAASQIVNWTTSNSSVASLSKTTTNGTSDAITVTAGNSDGDAVVTATTGNGAFSATCQISVQSVTGTTVMIYMCGADLESKAASTSSGYQGLASMDLNEILSVNGQPENVNIVVETGGAKNWAKSGIPNNKLARWEIRNNVMTKKAESGSPNSTVFPTSTNMGLTSTLQSFLEWGFQNYPSEKYGLILWNHGGAMNGCCFDENNGNDSLDALEVYNAVTNARTNKGIEDKLEWITYDACLMAVQDIAEYNSHNFNYMLCSQESESGLGYDYDAWLPSLYANPSIDGGELLEVIGNTFMVEERELYEDYWHEPFDQTQSVYDLTKMPAYKTAFENFATALNGVYNNNDQTALQILSSIKQCQAYGGQDDDGETVYPYCIYDLDAVLDKLVASYSSLSTTANAVKAARGNLVIYEEHGEATTGCGICIYVPTMPYNLPYDYSNPSQGYYGATSNFTNWKAIANNLFWADYDANYGS